MYSHTHVPHTPNNTALSTYFPPFGSGGCNRGNITKWGKMGMHIVTFKDINLGHNVELKNIKKLGYGSDQNDLL
jgi:hypothetical protein